VLSNNGSTPHRITHYRSERMRGAKQTRIAAHLSLEDEHLHKFHLFNTHLSLPTWWAKDFWQQGQKMGFGVNQLAEAKAVAEFAAATSHADPYLVVGDFNSLPGSPVYRYLRHDAKLYGAQEALKQIDPEDREAFPTAGFLNLRMHLDHVFASHGVDFEDLDQTHRFGDDAGPFHGLSDHVPLVLRFAPR
jgi:endonuclease/exonuclease/phosphatase family metal-dependent hydrolase